MIHELSEEKKTMFGEIIFYMKKNTKYVEKMKNSSRLKNESLSMQYDKIPKVKKNFFKK